MKRYYCQACHKIFVSDTGECPVCKSSDFTKLKRSLRTEETIIEALIKECAKREQENKKLKQEIERLKSMLRTEEEYD